jgi:hypothetical protein
MTDPQQAPRSRPAVPLEAREHKRFPSKVDIWLVVPVLLIQVGVPLAIIAMVPEPDRSDASVGAIIAIQAVAVSVTAWVFLSTSYRLDASQLVVRSGPFKWTVELSSLRRIRPTRSLLSAPALSLDRLELQYGPARTIVISPADRSAFLDAIAERAPGAVIEDGTSA